MKRYWRTWGLLLGITVVMLWLDGQSFPRLVFLLGMLAAMLTKASMIAATFMHLRFERASLVFTVVVGLLVTGAILYVLIAPDAARIHQMIEADQTLRGAMR